MSHKVSKLGRSVVYINLHDKKRSIKKKLKDHKLEKKIEGLIWDVQKLSRLLDQDQLP